MVSNSYIYTLLTNSQVNAFRERRALALTLNDTKTAVNKLHQIINVVVAIIVLIIWLLILEIATSKFLLFISSQLVLVAFIFGNTCKVIFESIVFLFIIHPFDVGDRCEVDGIQVHRLNLASSKPLFCKHACITKSSILRGLPSNELFFLTWCSSTHACLVDGR